MIKNTLIQVLLCWLVVVFTIMGIGKVIKGEDNITDPHPNIVLKEWTTQLIYDTTNACYQGTIKWIMLSHPALYGIPPGFESQRQMISHCFCVMDKIRKEYVVEEYRKKVFDGDFIGTLFMNKAFECVRDEKTLKNFFTVEGSSEIQTVPLDKFEIDNSTKILEEPKDLKEESPDLKQEESEMVPQTIFQG